MTSFFVSGVNEFCFFTRINYNVVTMVGLTNDERGLIHSLRAEKRCGSERIVKMV